MHAHTLKMTSKRVLALAVLVLLALGTLLGIRPGTAKGFPIPPITYSIIAVSGSHTASLLNLPVGQPGTYQAPIPVDINGDLLPDVMVSVNLVNVNGVFNNPPSIGSIIAPNIQIDRMVTAPILGQPSLPLKITVQLSIADSSGGPPTVLNFGYNTGQGGSIPTYFHALVGGLNNFFNPLQAVVDTTGTVVGLQPNINTLGLAPVAAPYQGPLHIIGGLSTASTTANLDFGFRPFPQTVTVGYGTDSSGQHVTYADSYPGQVDLSGNISLTSGGSTTNLSSRIDRLPNNLALNFNNGTTGNSGTVDMTSSQNGRLPDVGLNLSTTSPGARPLNANLSIDALPPVMHAEWSLPTGGPAHAAFCTPAAPSSSPCTAPQGAGIGSIQAQVTNYAPGASPISPWVPDQQQFLNFQQGGSNPANPDTLITARVERIRQLNFTQSTNGLDATAQLGDGELPLEAHFVTDGRGGTQPGPYTEATATVSPLPASAHLNFQLPPPGSSTAPTTLTYDASTPVDIAGNFKSFGATSGGVCGTNGTICANLQAFHIPSHVMTTITDSPSSTQINVDSSSPGTGATDPPDFIADATLGQPDNNHPIVAHAQMLGFPSAVTIYTHEGVNQTLDDAEFHACDWNVSASPPACATGQSPGKIGDLSFDVHDWTTRPSGLGQATPTTPMYADVEAAGVPTPGNSTVNYEATGDIKDISEVDYTNVGGVAGVRIHSGENQGFSAHINAQNILVTPTSDRITAVANVVVPTLPGQFDVCFRQLNRPIASTGQSYTVPCEDANPFGDANPLTSSPLTFAYRANTNFDVLTSGKVVDEGPASITSGFDSNTSQNRTYQGTLDITNLPQNLTANLQMPPAAASLTASLTQGESSGSFLSVNPLPFAVAAGDNIVVEGGTGGSQGTQTFVASGSAPVGSTSININPQSANANYSVGSAVQDQASSGIRALYCSGSVLPTAPSTCPSAASGDPQVNVLFNASVTDADLICKDPRTPAAGDIALCAQGELENLPSHALVNYNPTLPSNNFQVSTSGDKPMSLVGDAPCDWGSNTPVGTTIPAGSPQCFELSSVSLDSTTGKPDILIADGNVANLPKNLSGTLYFPQGGSPNVAITATPALGHVDAVVKNFIAPDPILQSVPDRSTGFGAPTQQVSFFQRGSAFEAEAHIGNVSGFAYQAVTDANGVPLDTQVIKAQFGGNQVIRAYADIEPSDSDRMIGDVTLNNVPAGLTVCIRGKNTHTSPTPVAGWVQEGGVYVDPPGPGQSTFCDNGDSNIPVGPSDGAFQFLGSPAAGASAGLGVDAFVRQATGGNSNILSGHVHIDGIPDVVEGTFPSSSTDGNLNVGGFDPCGMAGTPACGSQPPGTMVPAGIQHINADLASFDIAPADAGWTGTIPYAPLQDDNAPFPVPVPMDGHQYLEATLHNSAFQVRADIGPESELQQIEMLQGACAAPSNNPPDYPYFPTTVNGTTVKYKCIEANFVQTTPNAPIDLGFLDQTPDGNQLSFNGGLTDLPNHVQMTLSDVGSTTDSSLSACGPASGSNPANCEPPLVRFDQPANTTLFGSLQYGTAKGLVKLATVQPVETAANFGEAPNPTSASNPWNDWAISGNSDGVRAKLGIDNGAMSAIANLQLHIPQSLTIDQPLAWSQSESSDQQDYWQASDTKIHFIVRDSNGNPVGTLGQGSIMLNDFDDGYQILAGQPCLSIPLALRGSSPGNCSDFAHGFTLPGEVGVDMYRRDNSGQGKDYLQVDGRVSRGSQPLDIGVRLLAVGEQAAIGRLEGQILNVPTTSDVSGLGPNDPTFRLQEEMIGNGSSPPTGGQNPTAQGEQTQSVCSSAFFCSQVDVKIASVFASFNFQPSSAPPARLVQAVIDQVGSTKNGLEVAGFQGLTDSTTPAPVTAQGFVDINPLNIYIDAGIPLLAGADLALQSEIQANFAINDSTDFYVRENLLHLEAGSNDQDPSNPSALGPLNVFIYFLHAEADLLFVPLLTVDFDPTSIGPVDSIPGPPSGPAQLAEVDCSNFGTALATGIVQPNIPNNTIVAGSLSSPNNLLIWPFGPGEPRFFVGGVLGPVFDVLQHFASPFFCLMGAGSSDIPLRETNNYPSDPVGGLSTNPPATTPLVNDSHAIPGATLDPSITPATPPPATPTTTTAQPPPALSVTSPVALCGEHDFGNLTIDSSITVATTVNNTSLSLPETAPPHTAFDTQQPMCPTGSEGTLTIASAGHTVTIDAGGSINGSGVVASAAPLNLPHGDNGPGSPATGNGGGGHSGGGGGGSPGNGGSTYGDTSTDSTTETGVSGSSAGGGAAGSGGGAISIAADTLAVHAGGSITANGGGGGSGTAACASHDTPGGGGGSGGGIVINAVELDNAGTIAANGGPGGNSGIAPGGGGGGGIVKITAPIETGNAAAAAGAGGGGIPGAGTGSCPTSASNGGGSSGSVSANNSLSSETQPVVGANGVPKFWNEENTNAATASQPDLPVSLKVPYETAASNGATNGLQTFLCASYLSTSAYQTAAKNNPNDSLNQLFTMPNLPPGDYSDFLGPNSEPCGATFGFVLSPGGTLGESDFATNRVQGQSITIGNYTDGTGLIRSPFTGPQLADGYYGLYTVAAVPSTPGQSCADPLNSCTFSPLPSAPEQVIGIDNGPPALGFTVNGSNLYFQTNTTHVVLNITANGNQQESGLAQILCSNDGTKFTNCSNGTYDWNLTGGDGAKTVYVQAVNGAGMVTEQQVTGLLDTTPPTVNANVSGGTQVNGWYQSPPSIVLNASDGGAGLNQSEAFAYRFDDGAEHPTGSDPICAGPNPNPIPNPTPGLPPTPDLSPASCTIPQSLINSLSDGTHTLYYTAIDNVGNRLGPDDDQGNAEPGDQPMQSVTIQIDRTPPVSTILTVPSAPDGANGWFATRPWIVISAIDQVGGSGLTPFLGDNPVAGVSYYLDGTLHAAPPSPFPPLQPFQLTDGQHDVCWFAQDRAGNFDVSGPGDTTPTTGELAAAGQCQHFMVDSQAPSTTISTAPSSPNGQNGWFTSTVPVTIAANDPTPGSGTALVDPSDLCGPSASANGASGICVSIDHAAFTPYIGSFVIPAGNHDVRSYSVDAAGNVGPMVDTPINVDLTPPVASALTVPGAAAQNGWWRSAPFPNDQPHSPPQVVLRAVDGAQSSGVATLQYQLNPPLPTSPWVTYTGPFNVPEGVNTVNYRAIDNAGLIEPTQTLTVPVDVTPPVVTATSAVPTIWLQILDILGNILGLSPSTAQLGWTVSDNLSAHVHITVLVFNFTGAVVRQIDGGTYATTPGHTLTGSTTWDGRDQTITSLVPIGLYYYRVIATDDAGNVAQSGESHPIQIKI